MTASSNLRSRLGFFLLGLGSTVVAIVVGAFLYLKYGDPPVATADPSFPMEAQIVHIPLEARIKRQMQTAPFGPSEQVFEAGAQIYVAQCASCHGTPGHDVPFAKGMFPPAPQLWKVHGKGVVGVSDDQVGETYWKVDNGIRLTGMPSYQKVLSETQMWQVALLMKNADQPISTQVRALLQGSPSK